jgi:Na+/alanine symporter
MKDLILIRVIVMRARKEFDEMWDIAKLYVTACPNSVQLVPLHPIIISILFHHYKELKECVNEVEQIETKVSSNKLQK